MIHIEQLTKYYNELCAVDRVNLDINKGEILGLLGPNGAGKTTTLRILTGFLNPTSGTVRVNGYNIEEHLLKIKGLIGYLPESAPLYYNMLVFDYLNFVADIRGINVSQKLSRIRELANLCGLNEVMHKSIGEMSKGYKQRVGIASAILHQPRILIMDEPTEGLDPNQRAEIRKLVKNLAKGHTIIISTHVMQEAQAVCSRMIIINKGKLVADGTVDKLSREARGEHTLIVEAEGDGVEPSLRNLAGANHVDTEIIRPGMLRAKIIVDKSVELQPEISRIAREKNWTIWRLAEEEQKLEDIFHKLTSES